MFFVRVILGIMASVVSISPLLAGIPSTAYVQSNINAKMTEHTENTENPHNVTAAQVGLGNVKNVDTTNAANLTTGTVNVERLPVGTAANTVAAGDDTRFDTIATQSPEATPPVGRAFLWFN